MPVEGDRARTSGAVGMLRTSAPPGLAEGSQPVVVRLLGPVAAQLEGQAVEFPSPKARALFTLLALEPGRTVSVGRLVGGLWGDDPPDSATATLQAYVSRLRRALDRDGASGTGSSSRTSLRIRRQPPGYLLQVSGGTVDTERFLSLAAAAEERLELDPCAALELLEHALHLVVGEPLADVVDLLGSTGATEARRLNARVLDARERHLDALLRTGATDEALRRSSDLLTEHPLRESAQALHLLALYRSGREAEALSAYEQFRRLIADELGADPGPQLRRLHTRLLQQDPELDRDPRPSASARGTSGPEPVRRPAADLSIGREGPLQRLDHALTAALQGEGSVWLISGEAGIGKTTLCHDVARRAQDRGYITAWGRGQAIAGDAPYWLWAQVLRTLPPLWGQPEVEVVLGGAAQEAIGGPPPIHRSQLHQALALRLADHAVEERLVVLLEDLHWGDPLSLELLGAVVDAASRSPLVVVATVRSPHHPVAPALTSLLAQLATGPTEQIELTGLQPDEAVALLTRRQDTPDPGWVDAAVTKAEGNPFFLIELARLLGERSSAVTVDPEELGVPPTVRAVLRGRLTTLSATTRRLVEVAAVVGAETQVGLLEEVSGLPPGDLDAALSEAVGAGFVTEQLLPVPCVRFTHALVREAVYHEIPPLARARLHGSVGAALSTGRHDAPVDELARHLLAGAEVVGPGPALPALLRASRRAARQLALEHAERLLHQALALTRRLPRGRERDSWELAVQARIGSTVAMRLGWGAAEANRALERAQHLALRADPDEEMFAALYHRISWHVVTADLDTALTLSDVLMGRATTAGPTGQRFELLGRMARGAVSWFRGDDQSATTELVRADALAVRLGAALAEAFREHPQTPVLGFLAQALAGSGRSQEAWAAAGGAVMFAALLAVTREDRSAARDLAGELAELATASGLHLQRHIADIFGSWAVVTATGTTTGTEEVLAAMRAATEAYFATGARMLTPVVLTLLAEAELAQHQVDRARDAAAGALQARAYGMPSLWQERLAELVRRLTPKT
ncbi:hypothetical protein GCM10009616_14850 [Microlunatus lacustris]